MSFEPSDIDSLFENEESYEVEIPKILLIGSKETFDAFDIFLGDAYKLFHVYNIDNAITFLLQESFAVVILDNDAKDMKIVDVSNAVRNNHSLARIVVVTKKPKSSQIIEMVNFGSVDAILSYPLTQEGVYKVISEQDAKWSISKEVTAFITQPPKLSKASYLLLDPSLSFADENKPAKFVGIMIVSFTVPKYSKFFEDVLVQDDVLFAGFLSSIAIMGTELFANQEPLKEINFGGISVIFRFHDDIQISIFVRNLTRHNVDTVEIKIDEIVADIILLTGNVLTQVDIGDEAENTINMISQKFINANQEALIEEPEEVKDFENQVVLIFGSDEKAQEKLKSKLENRGLKVRSSVIESEAIRILQQENCGVLLLDSKIEASRTLLDFADYAKETKPSLQIILRERDMKSAETLITALNSDLVQHIIPYKEWFGSLDRVLKWTIQGLEKSMEIEAISSGGESMEITTDHMSIARTLLRADEDSYIAESKPELHGVLITRHVESVFEHFWEYDGQKINFDQHMLAGLVASLESIGEEMFAETESVGGLELGGANVLVQHRGDFNFSYFVKNQDPNTSVLIEKEIRLFTDEFYSILSHFDLEIDKYKLRTVADRLFDKFEELFGST
ncbi:MAG: hypothetical protein ACXAB7_04820 [Candidatus Kariarchaeaceae archaeon]|jgi:DNA-binding response OmpR family regulator